MDPKTEKLVKLVARYPGLDAIALKGKGWRPQTHGSLRVAQKAGYLHYHNGGWYVVPMVKNLLNLS